MARVHKDLSSCNTHQGYVTGTDGSHIPTLVETMHNVAQWVVGPAFALHSSLRYAFKVHGFGAHNWIG